MNIFFCFNFEDLLEIHITNYSHLCSYLCEAIIITQVVLLYRRLNMAGQYLVPNNVNIQSKFSDKKEKRNYIDYLTSSWITEFITPIGRMGFNKPSSFLHQFSQWLCSYQFTNLPPNQSSRESLAGTYTWSRKKSSIECSYEEKM